MTTTTDNKTLARIRALIAKAEATAHPAEAEAFMAKAQEMMTKHAIDKVMLEQADPSRKREEVEARKIKVQAPYIQAKINLLSGVARANGCRATFPMSGARGRPGEKYKNCTVYGFPSDIDNVEMLYTSLNMQAVIAMQLADMPEWENVKSFRNSFLLEFGNHIGYRLKRARRNVADEAGDGVSLMLRSREDEVQDKLPSNLKKTDLGAGVTSAAGANAGWESGEAADIGQQRVGGARGVLTP